MPLSENVASPIDSGTPVQPYPVDPEIQDLLRQTFGTEFHLIETATERLIYRGFGQPIGFADNWFAACREVANRGRVELIDEAGPFLVLAIPLGNPFECGSPCSGKMFNGNDAEHLKDSYAYLNNNCSYVDTQTSLVAAAVFIGRSTARGENLFQTARMLGIDTEGIDEWAVQQMIWPPQTLLRVGQAFLRQLAEWQRSEQLLQSKETDRRKIESLMQETQSLSENLSSTYEEISLLYRLTQNLKLSEGNQQLERMALEWLHEVIPAEAIAMVLHSTDDKPEMPGQNARTRQLLLSHGKCAIDAEELTHLIDHLRLSPSDRPFVANSAVTSKPSWPCEKIRQVVIVPVAEGDNVFGWLAAVNHLRDGSGTPSDSGTAQNTATENMSSTVEAKTNSDRTASTRIDATEFGTVEASLLSSVGIILGIHNANIHLYRQQAEMFSGIVRALTSAIDAKDQYTHGHSDRVARIAVRLADELGCQKDMLDTIYLAGLLHDIGKIGIDDQVLRKPGKLSDEQYQHIKSHTEVGYRILHGLRQMDDLLPVVLHHHESWDGRGYPYRLLEEQIPLMARIVAVADSYDAMSSDRPYRKGMPATRIDRIFREGSGRQWDPQVVAAFFRARDAIRKIALQEQDASPLES